MLEMVSGAKGCCCRNSEDGDLLPDPSRFTSHTIVRIFKGVFYSYNFVAVIACLDFLVCSNSSDYGDRAKRSLEHCQTEQLMSIPFTDSNDVAHFFLTSPCQGWRCPRWEERCFVQAKLSPPQIVLLLEICWLFGVVVNNRLHTILPYLKGAIV